MYIKTIRSYTLISCFMAMVSIAFAQPEFTAEVTQLLPSFKFKDSEGRKLNSEYQSLITGAYGIGLRYIFESGIYLRGGVGLRNAGATWCMITLTIHGKCNMLISNWVSGTVQNLKPSDLI